MNKRHTDIRYREDFEAKCLLCNSWFPLTLDFWYPKAGMARCRACWRAYHRAHEAGRRGDDAVAEGKREANRLRYWANRPKALAAGRRWRAAHVEEISAYNRAYRARNAERLRLAHAAYYADARAVILVKKRRAYAERVA